MVTLGFFSWPILYQTKKKEIDGGVELVSMMSKKKFEELVEKYPFLSTILGKLKQD